MNDVQTLPAGANHALKDLKERIGCSTLTFKELPLHQAVERIASMGFRAIDIPIVPCNCCHIEPVGWTSDHSARLLENLGRLGIRVSSLNVSADFLPARHDDEPWEFTEKCIRIAAELKAYNITVAAGPAVEEKDWLEAARKRAERLRGLANAAESAGVRLSVEAPHLYTLAEDYAHVARLFDTIKDPRIGCTFDTSHAQRNAECSVEEGSRRVHAEVVHVHLRDAVGGNIGITPGKGNCDYLSLIKGLAAAGYKGDFNFELEYRNASEKYVEQELEFARVYLDLLLEGGPMPPEYAVWKDKRRQFKTALLQNIRDPKSFVVQRPGIKNTLKPIVTFLRKNLPTRYTRLESHWQKHWGIEGDAKIKFSRGGARAGAGQKTVRVGILGCGNVGAFMHAPGFARLPGVEVVGVCDKQPKLADALARQAGCRAFYTVEDLVRETKPGLVANCTKEWIHHGTTMYLLENGVDVFCEKIMAEEMGKGEEMVARAAANGRMLAVNFNWRFLPGIMKIKQIKDSGALGELCILRFFCHAWVWHHGLDLVGYLGGRPSSVSAIMRQDAAHKDPRPWRRFADSIPYVPSVYTMATFETEEGVAVNITSSEKWSPQECLFNIDAVFRRGTVCLSGISSWNAVGVLSSDQPKLDLTNGVRPADGASDFSITFQRSIEAFAQAYFAGKRPPSTGEDGLRAMKLEEAVGRAAVSGQKIPL